MQNGQQPPVGSCNEEPQVGTQQPGPAAVAPHPVAQLAFCEPRGLSLGHELREESLPALSAGCLTQPPPEAFGQLSRLPLPPAQHHEIPHQSIGELRASDRGQELVQRHSCAAAHDGPQGRPEIEGIIAGRQHSGRNLSRPQARQAVQLQAHRTFQRVTCLEK